MSNLLTYLPTEGWAHRHLVTGDQTGRSVNSYGLNPTHFMTNGSGITRVALTAPMLAAITSNDASYLRIYTLIATGKTGRSGFMLRYTLLHIHDHRYFLPPGIHSNTFWRHRIQGGGDPRWTVNSHYWNFVTSQWDEVQSVVRSSPTDQEIEGTKADFATYIQDGTNYLYYLVWDYTGGYDNALPSPGDSFSVSVSGAP